MAKNHTTLDAPALLNAAISYLRETLDDAAQADTLNQKLGALGAFNRQAEQVRSAIALVVFERELARDSRIPSRGTDYMTRAELTAARKDAR